MSDEPTPPAVPTPPNPPPPAPPPVNPAAAGALAPVRWPGPYPPNHDERTMGMLIHLLAILTGFIGPLVLWLVRRESSGFIDHHGKEAVNFQIALLIVMVGATVVGAILGLLTLGVGMLLLVPVFIVVPICALVFEIMACIRANRGEWSHYPLNFRFIR